MGNIASSNTKSRLGISLTLDAFGTLYHPKKPIAVQYLEVARRCGLKVEIQLPHLEASFRREYKEQSAKYPNYGKAKGMSVESWWNNVVHGAFRPLCRGQHIPDSLGPTLFRHFSSRDAYALYPDVVPFFESMRKLRDKYSDPRGPIIVIGVITNSDNRARPILRSLGLQVGPEWEPSLTITTFDGMKRMVSEGVRDAERRKRESGTVRFTASGPALHWYKSTHDINFLVTSHATGYEKPDRRIFREADALARNLPTARLEQFAPDESFGSRSWETAGMLVKGSNELSRIHVGDDMEKDYQGAKATGRQALHLCRGEKGDLKNHQISNLGELATLIELMSQVNFSSAAAHEIRRKP